MRTLVGRLMGDPYPPERRAPRKAEIAETARAGFVAPGEPIRHRAKYTDRKTICGALSIGDGIGGLTKSRAISYFNWFRDHGRRATITHFGGGSYRVERVT